MRYSRRNTIALALLLISSCCAFGQNAPLTKDSIIVMIKAGLPEDVIISKIRAEVPPLNASTDDLIALKAAGASDGIIRALVAPPPGLTTPRRNRPLSSRHLQTRTTPTPTTIPESIL